LILENLVVPDFLLLLVHHQQVLLLLVVLLLLENRMDLLDPLILELLEVL
jgi:hypothetical protein